MSRELKVQGGKILLWRLGDLTYSEQRHDAAPRGEISGMWAFPWPYFDLFFAFHKFEDALPKRFKTSYLGYTPLHNSEKWMRIKEENGDERTLTPAEVKEIQEWLNTYGDYRDYGTWEPMPDKFTVAQEFFTEKEKWIETTGKRIVPLKKFWYSGDLYSRMGNLSHDEEWTRMGAMEFAREVKRKRGIAHAGRISTGWGAPQQEYTFTKVNNFYSVDHLEVFLPRGAGRISGKGE